MIGLTDESGEIMSFNVEQSATSQVEYEFNKLAVSVGLQIFVEFFYICSTFFILKVQL